MYFTKSTNSFRGWFQAVSSDGTLRTGILSSSFIGTVIDSDDTNSTIVSITQSQQKPGLYYFDITSSFFEANGPGEYGISIEVSESSTPEIVAAFSRVLSITQNDFDSLNLSASNNINTIVSGVWNAQTASFVSSGSFGNRIQAIPLSSSVSASCDLSAISTKIEEIYQIMGLELGSPLTVSTTQRVVAAITQSISGDPESSVTVTRS